MANTKAGNKFISHFHINATILRKQIELNAMHREIRISSVLCYCQANTPLPSLNA